MEEIARKELKLRGVSSFMSFNVGANKIVTLKIKMKYDEVITSVQLLQGLNTDINVLAKLGPKGVVKLGVLQVNAINFDKDGNAQITFKSMSENVELGNIMELIDEEYFQIMFKAVIELTDDEYAVEGE